MSAMSQMMERGLLVQAIRPPTVPVGTARLRLSLSSALGDSEISLVVSAVRELEAEGWFAPHVPRGTPG
jgi:8-amino-7-oxononanoate synthase